MCSYNFLTKVSFVYPNNLNNLYAHQRMWYNLVGKINNVGRNLAQHITPYGKPTQIRHNSVEGVFGNMCPCWHKGTMYVCCCSLCFSCSPTFVLDLHNESCIALINIQRSYKQNHVDNWTSPYFSYDERKCMFVDSYTSLTGPANCVHYWV